MAGAVGFHSSRTSAAGWYVSGLDLWCCMPEPRDAPINLSDSRPETHQHRLPAGATCCQSLLLDPDATIGIDLHKRLFLLVTGRGE
jgi:hypothetical protein